MLYSAEHEILNARKCKDIKNQIFQAQITIEFYFLLLINVDMPIIVDFWLLVGCFELNGPLRQYFSLYRTVSQREGERREK